jgi:uracil-DNA glycosylase family 4
MLDAGVSIRQDQRNDHRPSPEFAAMGIAQNLSVLACRQLLGGACSAVGCHLGEDAAERAVEFLVHRFTDQSQRLSGALEKANDRGWSSLEIALAGDSLWERCKLLLAPGEEKAFREQVRAFLDVAPLGDLPGHGSEFRQECLRQLRAARKAGALQAGALNAATLAREVGAFARFSDPRHLIAAEFRVLEQTAEELKHQGYGAVAHLVTLRPDNGEPLLVLGVRYFFRRAIEEDSQLFQGLAFAQLERLQQTQEQGFAGLHRLLTEQGARLQEVLESLEKTVAETHAAVLDIQEEQKRQGEQHRDIYHAVIDVQRRLDLLQREVRPRDSLSIRSDGERRLVREVVLRYRALPEERRRELPALLNAVGKLEVAAGEFGAAEKDFAAVAGLVTDRQARGEAHLNAHRAALENRDWDTALRELLAAVKLDEARFAPFPVAKYEPRRILGAGGFGVAYLCRHRQLGAEVVVKTIIGDGLDRSVEDVFAEAKALWALDHPAIIRLLDCGYADPAHSARPYFVMNYFEGQTLEVQARAQPLAVDDLLSVARQMADGLHAAHSRGILHRDVKPGNVLVRQGADGWQVKLIDFGLALRHDSLPSTAVSSKTLHGSSIAGTLDYAAPEQMGKLSGVTVGPTADVYGFARTCCYALFGTPQPLPRHWRSLPQPLADLLEQCLEEKPEQRPAFPTVLQRLPRSGAAGKCPLPVVETAPTAPAADPATLTPEQRLQELAALAERVRGCTRCPVLVRSRTHTVFGTGPLDPDVLFIGEAPGGDEDAQGEPFVGAAGQLLNRIIAATGLKREDVYICNVLKCRPPGNRTPQPDEVHNCSEYLHRQIALVRPKVICALGGCAAQNLLGSGLSLGKLRGRWHDYRGTPVLCTYHPAFLLPHRSPEKKKDVWEDMKLLLQRLGRPIPGTARPPVT